MTKVSSVNRCKSKAKSTANPMAAPKELVLKKLEQLPL